MDDYYVYAYLDPRKSGVFQYDELLFEYEPFYVGKGIGNRCYIGLKGEYHHLTYRIHRLNKFDVIKEIIKDGFLPIVVKINENLSTNEIACQKEIEAILKIGRLCKKSGPLTNLTDGGNGGYPEQHSEEWIAILSKQILQYSKDNVFIAEYSSITEASKQTGICGQNISDNARGKYKSAGGFLWKYKNKKDILQGHLAKPFERVKHTEATKEKMRKPKSLFTKDRMKKNAARSQSIYQVDEVGNILKEWNSITSALLDHPHLSKGNIRRSCNNQRPRIVEKFIWKSIDRRVKAILIGKQKDAGRKVRWKRVVQVDPKTNEIIKEWENVTLAEKYFNTNKNYIRNRIDKEQCCGFIWSYPVTSIESY